MVYIGTPNFTQKNRFKSVWTDTMDRKRPVLGGSVRFPQYLGWSWTGCGPRLPVLGAKNRTEPDLRTLFVVAIAGLLSTSFSSSVIIVVGGWRLSLAGGGGHFNWARWLWFAFVDAHYRSWVTGVDAPRHWYALLGCERSFCVHLGVYCSPLVVVSDVAHGWWYVLYTPPQIPYGLHKSTWTLPCINYGKSQL